MGEQFTSPYEQMIVSCLVHRDAADPGLIGRSLAHCNERRLFEFAELHESATIVAARLEQLGKSSPMWRTAAADWKYRLTQRFEQLEMIMQSARDAGLRPVALKSAAVTLAAYPHYEESPMGNFDLLVPADDFDRFCALLEGQGFTRPTSARNDGIVEYSRELCDDVMWIHLCRRALRVTRRFSAEFSDTLTKAALNTAKPAQGSACPVPDPAVSLAICCLDIARRSYVCVPGIRMYTAPDRLVRAFPNLNWHTFHDCIRGAEADVYFALYFTHALFDSPIPADIFTRLQPDKRLFDGVMRCVHRTGFFYPPKKLPLLRQLALEFWLRHSR